MERSASTFLSASDIVIRARATNQKLLITKKNLVKKLLLKTGKIDMKFDICITYNIILYNNIIFIYKIYVYILYVKIRNFTIKYCFK